MSWKFYVFHSQTCSNDHLYKTTTCLKGAMLSTPKQTPIKLLLYKTTTSPTQPATTFFFDYSPKLSKISVTCLNSVKTINLGFHKVIKLTINFDLLKVRKITSLRILEKLETSNLDSRVNLIQGVLLGTSPQKKLTSLSHIYMTLTDLFTVVSEATVIKFDQ